MTLTPMDYWRLSDELSVIDAAILITGNDPSDNVQYDQIEGFDPVIKALKNAILSNRLAAALAYPVGAGGGYGGGPKLMSVLREGTKLFETRELKYWDHDALVFLQAEPDWERTLIEVVDLKAWLKGRNLLPTFFFPHGDPHSYMNKDNPRYAAKLACAVAAWSAVTSPAKNRTPKQTIEAWVVANGVQFGLSNDEGTVPQTAVDEIAKVTNWQPQGGAARTGVEVGATLPETEGVRPVKALWRPGGGRCYAAQAA